MGIHYYVYAEIKVNDKWYNLNPLMKKHDGTTVLRPVYDCGSMFFEACNFFEDHIIGVGIPDDMSPELRGAFRENIDEPCDPVSKDTWRQFYDQSLFCVNYSDTIEQRVIKDRPHKYEGYVSKRAIADFEVNETEEINSWLTREEYNDLPERQKRLYRFYQWDEDFDEYRIFRTIYERLCALLYWFDFADAFENKSEYWRTDVSLSDVRLFIERN